MKNLIVVFLVSILFMSCTAKVVVVDRPTLIEEEAAVKWPSFEKEIQKKIEKRGPSFFAKRKKRKQKGKILNVLNSEFDETSKKTKTQ